MALTRRSFLSRSAMTAGSLALAEQKLFAQTPAAAAGPFQPTWESMRDQYHSPSWLPQNRLGIFIHWGLYSIPARINEWYPKHMYTSDVKWHTEHYGPPDKFGYKDFIPLFTVPNYRPAEWAKIFKDAGAGYVMPVAEHHDGFAMWDSDLTRWCAGKMGPKRDLIGELAAAVRSQGMIFSLSNHRMEHHTFMYPAPGVPNDQFDPQYADFYGPPQMGDIGDGLATEAFQRDWLARCKELVDKYQPQLFYFDNGVNHRAYDRSKLQMAAFYYNQAAAWGKEVAVVAKAHAYLAGSVMTYERQIRAPKWTAPTPWLSDDTLGVSTWGYTDGMKYRSAAEVVTELIELTCRNGGLLLNVSPMGDGSIPDEQQRVLREVGVWMRANAAAINGTTPWRVFGEGPEVPLQPPADALGVAFPDGNLPPRKYPPVSDAQFRFTTRGDSLYVLGLRTPASGTAKIVSLGKQHARVEKVTLLATGKPMPFQQTADALSVTVGVAADQMPYALELHGSHALGA